MIADTPEELHTLAGAIGMKRVWFQPSPPASFPHYDLSPSKRKAAVGAGGMVIALAEILRGWGALDKHFYVDCTDIDIRCVHMAYIHFTLLDIPAVVRHGDTLRMTFQDHWHTLALARCPWMTFKPEFPDMDVLL